MSTASRASQEMVPGLYRATNVRGVTATGTSGYRGLAGLLTALQRGGGNRAVTRLLREATDPVPLSVMTSGVHSTATAVVQRQDDGGGAHIGLEEEEPAAGHGPGHGSAVQAKAVVGLRGGPLNRALTGAIEARRGGGVPLDAAVRTGMEIAFGTGFGDVRVHADGEAHRLNRAISAVAFTTGSDIFFRQGAYEPATSGGHHLLAHELAHVVQQRTMAPGTGGPLTVGLAGDVHEREAAAAADAVAAALGGRDVGPAAGAGPAGSVAAHSVPDGARGVAARTITGTAGGGIIHRYTVPGTLECSDVVDWLNANSPYAPEWAETRSTYSFAGNLRITYAPRDDGTVQCRIKGHGGVSVAVRAPVDLPHWSPSARPNRAAEVQAWQDMLGVLGTHENAHRTIAQTWRATLDGRFKGYDHTETGSNQAEARTAAVAALQADQQQWAADAQADQTAIDPFRGAVLTCP